MRREARWTPAARAAAFSAAVALILAPGFAFFGGVSLADERRADALLLFSGSVHGFLEECGCESFPLGGLDRRSGFLRLLRREHRGTPKLFLDVGNFSDETSPAGRVKTRRLLEAMGRLGYVASGVGARDLAWGAGGFEALTAGLGFPLLSANLVRESSREPWLEPFTVVTAGELRVGIISVTGFDPTLRVPLAEGDAVVSIDPALGVRRALDQLEGRSDLVVLLAALPLEDVRVLARRVPGVDLVFGSLGAMTLDLAETEGDTRILYCGNEGQYIGQVGVYLDEQGEPRSFEEKLVALGDAIPSDPAMEAFMIEGMVEAQEAELAALAELRAQISGGAHAGPTYLGSGSCTACHADIVANWSETRHRHAWESLQRKPRAFKQSCVACHVTGYGEPSGYVDGDTTPHLQEVGCESCHGPASEHVRRPKQPYGSISIASCTGCHDAANDPDFNYYEERRLVAHEEDRKRD